MSEAIVIQELKKELEKERSLNAEIKARFVKCNTCTPDMKEKCLMFNENLCEGERCEELVDLMSLVNKRDTDDKLEKAKEHLEKILFYAEQYLYEKRYADIAILIEGDIKRAKQFLKEEV